MTRRDAISGEAPPVDSTSPTPTPSSSDDRRELPRTGGDWWKVLLVLCVAYFPLIYANYVYLARKSWLDPDFPEDFYWGCASDLVYLPINCILILYLVWRKGERWSTLGVVPVRWIRDPIAAIGCFAAIFAAYWLGCLLLFAEPNGDGPLFLQTSTYSAALAAADAALTSTPEGILLWIASTCVAALFEELLYRGYLVTRLSRLLQSSWLAVLFAALLFGIAHFYQGVEGVLPAWVMGMMFGGLFLRLRTLWPLSLAHSAYNLWVTWP